MVIPDVLTLDVLKNTFRDGIFTKTFQNTQTVDVETPLFAVHKEDFKALLFQVANGGVVNSFDYKFYGSAIDDQSHGTDVPFSPPPDFVVGDTEEWFPLPNGTGTVAPDTSDAQNVSDNWTWVLITTKPTVPGDFSVNLIHVRGE